MVITTEIIKYTCEVCNKEYTYHSDALTCEQQEPKKKYDWNIGDKVCVYGPDGFSEMGVIVGATPKNHGYIPQIKITENYVFWVGEYEEIK